MTNSKQPLKFLTCFETPFPFEVRVIDRTQTQVEAVRILGEVTTYTNEPVAQTRRNNLGQLHVAMLHP